MMDTEDPQMAGFPQRSIGTAAARAAVCIFLLSAVACQRVPSPLAEYHLSLGSKYVREGEDFLAEREFTEALRVDPSLDRARLELARLLARCQRWTDALPHLRRLYESGDSEGSLEYLRVLFTLGRTEEAGQLATRLLRQHPGDLRTWDVALDLVLDAGQNERALALVNSARAVVRDDNTLRTLRAKVLFRTGRTDEALELYEALGDGSGLAECYAALGDLDKAAQTLLSSGAHPLQLIRLKMRAGELGSALSLLEEYLAAEPASKAGHYLCGSIQAELGKIEEAKAHAQAAAGFLELPVLAARIAALDNAKDALATLDAHLQQHKRCPDGWTARGDIAVRLGQFVVASDSYRRSLAFEESPRVRVKLCEALRALGNKDALLQEVEAAIARFPHVPYIRLESAMVFFQAGDTERSLHEVEEHLKLAPDSPRGRLLLGMVRERRGEWGPAVEQYKLALRGDASLADGYLGLSRCLVRQGFKNQARLWLDRGLQALPDSAGLKEAAQKLSAPETP